MSDVATKVDEPASGGAELPKKYGFSALISGLAHMWRGTGPALILIAVNAVVQALLVYVNAQVSMSFAFIASLIVSVLVLLVCEAGLIRTALLSVDGKAHLGEVMGQAKSTLGGFALWSAIRIVLVIIGALLFNLLGVIIAMLLVFIPYAASDGKVNPLKANFAAIKDRWGRWLLTAVLVTIGAIIVMVLNAFNVFFVKGFPAALIAWLIVGVIAWWLHTSWAGIYRSTRVGADGAASSDAAASTGA